jgi:hypothetical protein
MGFGVYAGTIELTDGPLRILPVKRFLQELSSGPIFPADVTTSENFV